MRVRIDLDKCRGYGSCVLPAPDVFQMDDSGDFAIVLVEYPSEDRRSAVTEAAKLCPQRAIIVTDDVSG